MKSLILLSLVFYSSSYDCWQYTCTSLEASDLCAQNSGNSFSMRTTACPEDKICHLADVIDSFASGQPTYACQLKSDVQALDADFQVDEDYDFKESSACERLPNKGLKEGSYPKKCTTEDDCILEDTTTTSCKCGFNSSVCVPHYSSSFFDEWFTACDESEPDSDMYYEIWLVRKYYPWMATYADSADFECAYDVFNDLSKVNQYYEKMLDGTFYESGKELVVYLCLGVLALIL